jgi:putative hydrolase of HD superfamily
MEKIYCKNDRRWDDTSSAFHTVVVAYSTVFSIVSVPAAYIHACNVPATTVVEAFMNLSTPRFQLLRLFFLLFHFHSTASFCAPPRIIITTSSKSMSISNSDTKQSSSSTAAAAADAKSAIDFLTLARGLKTTPRTGWIRQEAGPKIESVADHSWRIALMSLVASTTTSSSSKNNTTVDSNKCLKMALVHDLAEAQVGDITPHCGVSDTDKHQQELSAMTQMTDHLQSTASFGMAGKEILDLWKEYEEGTSLEAKLVKDMDKLEMTLQALEYEQDGKNQKSLDGFFDSTRDKWRTDIGRAWGQEIEARRQKRKVGESSSSKEKEGGEIDEPDTKKTKL